MRAAIGAWHAPHTRGLCGVEDEVFACCEPRRHIDVGAIDTNMGLLRALDVGEVRRYTSLLYRTVFGLHGGPRLTLSLSFRASKGRRVVVVDWASYQVPSLTANARIETVNDVGTGERC